MDLGRLFTDDVPEFLAEILWFGLPPWALPYLLKRKEVSGWQMNQFFEFVMSQVSRPLLWIRPNFPDIEKTITNELKEKGFNIVQTVTKPTAWAIEGRLSIYQLDCFKKGQIEIQDLASQMIGDQVQCVPGDYVWDACAGGGGKTMQIAAKLQNKGVVYATDVRSAALQENKLRVRRAQFSNVRYQLWDGKSLLESSKEIEKRKGFDWVLVDAPCTSSGTWRRNPDAKLRLDHSRIAEFPNLQKEILNSAAKKVKPRGHLVYGTCSFLVEENEEVVKHFLAHNPDFSLVYMGIKGPPGQNSDSTFVALMARKN